MKIIVGLGNPGVQYSCTPHNIGFAVVDRFAEAIGAVWEFKKAFSAIVSRGMCEGEAVLLVKPQTYMNLSGDAVAPLVRYHNSMPAELIVIQDDIDLPVGRLRVRKQGSAGGHNGVRSLISRLGTQDFVRLKLGVGKDRANVIGHVLGKFDPTTRLAMDEVVCEAVKVVSMIVREGPERAMNAYNGWVAASAKP